MCGATRELNVKKPSISIVGPGSLAEALVSWLHAAGYTLPEIIARPSSMSRARRLARGTGDRPVRIDQAALTADIVWFCVPDDVIAACAADLAPRADWKGRIALHSSGALPGNELAPLRRRGAAVGSVHPMMTFVRGARPPSPVGIPFAVEGEPKALRVARAIVRDLRGEIVAIKARNKPLYHALGAFASPLIVAELALAERVARAAGMSPGAARRIVAPILRKTIDNYLAHGAAVAFSGPLVRGDLQTVRMHLAVLKRVPGAREAYLALARSALGNLPVGGRRELERLLKHA